MSESVENSLSSHPEICLRHIFKAQCLELTHSYFLFGLYKIKEELKSRIPGFPKVEVLFSRLFGNLHRRCGTAVFKVFLKVVVVLLEPGNSLKDWSDRLVKLRKSR